MTATNIPTVQPATYPLAPDPWVGWYSYLPSSRGQVRELVWTSAATGVTWQECRIRTERAAPAGTIHQVLRRGTHPGAPTGHYATPEPVLEAVIRRERSTRAPAGQIEGAVLAAFVAGEWAQPTVIMQRLGLTDHARRTDLYSVLSRLRRGGKLVKRKTPKVEYARAEVASS